MMEGAIIPMSEGGDNLPEYGEDEVSKVVYPEVRHGEKDKEYVSRAVKGKYNWIWWVGLAAIGFGVFLASCSALAEFIIK
jgi:hypothetical protein